MNMLPTNLEHKIASIAASETQPHAALPVNQGSLVGRSGIVLTVAIVLLAALTLLPSSKVTFTNAGVDSASCAPEPL